MASNDGGYKLDFTAQPSESLKCPICLSVARKPWQHGNCGRIICESCLEWYKKKRSQRPKHKCPHCGQDDPQFFQDNQNDQRIQELKVNCNNKKYGCEWTGELRFLAGHLTTCPYNIVTCPKKCTTSQGKIYECFQKEIDLHLRESCPLRDFKCPRCEKWGTYTERTTSHLKTCPMMPKKCPIEGCSEEVPSHMLDTHLSTCDYVLEDCKYKNLGCTAKVLRRDMKGHECDDKFHLHMMMGSIIELQKKLLQTSQELSLLRNVIPSQVTFKVTGFSKYRKNEIFFCKPFYTSLRGYKLCARVIPKWVNQTVCVCIHLMKGEFDDDLKWPFTGTIEVELLNQQENSRHISRSVKYLGEEEGKRLEKGEINESGYGYYNFISLDKLQQHQHMRRYCGPVYLMDDTLYFRVTPKNSWLECTHQKD